MLDYVKEERWNDIRDDVSWVNPELAKLIDDFNPGKELTLFRVRYPFGMSILENGTFNLPTTNLGAVPLNDSRIPENIRKKLGYSGTIPMGVVLNRTTELIMDSDHRIIPFMLMQPGRVFSLWRVLDPPHSYFVKQVWSMYAGARFIFLAPKITDTVGHKRLKRKYGVRSELPRDLLDHGVIFKEIANHKDFPCPNHHTEMLFFSEKWLERQENNPRWLKLHNYLLQYAWNDTQYWRNKVVFDFAWDSFVYHLTKENFRPSSHIIDIVKHLILIGTGILPGFSPVVDSDFVTALQEVYVDGYGLKNYMPIVMQSCHFSLDDNAKPVYYSLQLQTQFESSPKPKFINSIASEMRDVEALLVRFIREASQGKLKEFIDTLIYDFAKKVKYTFYHTDTDPDGVIQNVKNLPRTDSRLLEGSGKKKGWPKAFAETSPFFRGCIQISMVI